MSDETKKFDAVGMMREARDRISRDTRNMSFEEQRAYYSDRAEKARKRLNLPEKPTAG